MNSRLDPITAQSNMNCQSSRHYAGFAGQYINGAWRRGRSGRTRKNAVPYTSETLVEVALIRKGEFDEDYQAAATTQALWTDVLAAKRADILIRSAAIMRARREEIIDWLMAEFTTDYWVTVQHAPHPCPF